MSSSSLWLGRTSCCKFASHGGAPHKLYHHARALTQFCALCSESPTPHKSLSNRSNFPTSSTRNLLAPVSSMALVVALVCVTVVVFGDVCPKTLLLQSTIQVLHSSAAELLLRQVLQNELQELTSRLPLAVCSGCSGGLRVRWRTSPLPRSPPLLPRAPLCGPSCLGVPCPAASSRAAARARRCQPAIPRRADLRLTNRALHAK